MGMRAFFAIGAAAIVALTAARADDAGHWAVVNGHRLYYEIHGTGSPVLLLHGGGNSVSGSWARQIVDFSPTHEVIAPEQVGNGHTPDVAGPFSYAQMTEDTAALLRQLNLKRVDAVGWSDGAIIALMLAVRYPELVRRVVATGANVDPNGLLPNDLASLRASPPAADAGAEKLRQLWLTRPVPEELSFELLKTIHAKVLVMAGDHDGVTLEHTLRIYHAIPDAELWILPHTGHGTFVERPAWTDPMVLDFLL